MYFSWNYTSVLNIVAVIGFAVLFWLYRHRVCFCSDHCAHRFDAAGSPWTPRRSRPRRTTMGITDHEHPIDPERVAHARARLPSADDAARLTGLLSLMADPVRLRLIYALDVSEAMYVGDLALALEVSRDSVSHALRLLRSADLVTTRKQGRVVYNRLADDFPEPLRDTCLRRLIAMKQTDE